MKSSNSPGVRWSIAIGVCLVTGGGPAGAADIDLTRATVVTPPGLTGPEQQAVRMLVEEVEERSWVDWKRGNAPADGTPVLLVGPAGGVQKLADARGVKLPDGPANGREGYRIGVESGGKSPVVWVAGNDSRGVLFGVGRLLRELRMERQRVTLPADFRVTSAPLTPLRGHQIGYRPKTNSYDGWTAAMWEQYVRDLVVFGCNAIELIPPRSDDAADSPLFPQPQLKMMTAVSGFADAYGLDVWVWYPAMDRDYADPKTVEFALKEWAGVFQALPRIDAVFVPGGDPGHTKPDVLFALLEKQTANLKRFHPKAQMWMSPQSFTGPWMDEFATLIRQEPAWLSGVVHGPQVRVSLPALRAMVPPRYPIRDYPDITHSRTCQYPVPDWDVAFALTEARECCNPRPTQMAAIYRYARPNVFGYITYSEGCHDDVNKCVWSALGWDENIDLRTVLREYARYYISPALADRFAEGLFALERNWVGPVAENAGIDETLALFRSLERAAGPREKVNWRFQQALYRAYYDAFVRARVRHETGATDAARALLRTTKQAGSAKAMADAEAILDRAAKEAPGADLRARTSELAEALFQSVRAQLSVAKYHAISVGRGANFDTIDVPLSDAAWLRAEIAAARQLGDEAARVARLTAAVDRENPGPGGFYDDLGDARRQPHLVREPAWAKDPAHYAAPLSAFGRGSAPANAPRPWWNYAQTHFDAPLKMHYTGLDRTAAYRVRVVYAQGEGRNVKLTANGGHEVHGYVPKQFVPQEFAVPAAATAGGELTLTWTEDPGAGGAGRGCQVAEVWLLKQGAAAADKPAGGHTITIRGSRFLLDGRPFPFTGVSFFNAIFNPALNQSPAERRQLLARFPDYGVNVLRIWGQWDNKRGFVDAGPDSTLYYPDGRLREEHLRTLKGIIADADMLGMVVQLCLFANESRRDGIQLSPAASDRAAAALAEELKPFRNLTFQVWNEHTERTLDTMRVIKRVDPDRLVTNSPGVSSVLGGDEENRALDYLTPHTARYGDGRARPWEVGPKQIAGLLAKFNKPVVDDEPARTGTAQFGGPKLPTAPHDHVLSIWQVWQAGGYVVYHHDMFQTGYGTPAVPPNGIPDPEFSPYHRPVFEFLKLRDRYAPPGAKP